MQKGKKFFNIIIGIIVIALVVSIVYAAYYYISKQKTLNEAQEAVDEFKNKVTVVALNDKKEDQQPEEPDTDDDNDDDSYVYYRGYEIIGIIEIPKIDLRAPIVDKVTVDSISAAVRILYGPGLNQVGNTVLAAHNYRDGTFFSNNKNLAIGDKIYITDITGTEIRYSITKSYVAGEMDFNYAVRDTNRKT